ncbi:MAG: hypothetical protein IPP79_19725 [Chitinophagaceae bacterium]|nr:hypothetical protein [Chitinophagaceae bacterium]
MDLSYKELLTLLLCDSINPVTGVDGSGNAIRAISIVSIDGDNSSCELDNLKLSGVTTTHLKKIHLFIRLWKKTGWTLFDLDRACIAFGLDFGNNVVQNKSKLNNIAQTDVLAKQLRLPLESILAFWRSISTRSYIDYF